MWAALMARVVRRCGFAGRGSQASQTGYGCREKQKVSGHTRLVASYREMFEALTDGVQRFLKSQPPYRERKRQRFAEKRAFGKLLVDSTYPARLAPYETGVSQRVPRTSSASISNVHGLTAVKAGSD